MNKAKFCLSLVLAASLLVGQVGIAVAAPASQHSAPIIGTIHSITLEMDSHTGIIIVTVEVTVPSQDIQIVRISQVTASAIGLVALDGDGNPIINKMALGKPIEIDPKTILPPPDRHPVGDVLATFFSNIADYDTIMAAHEQGLGFGVITQALWLAKQLHGNGDVFTALLEARRTGDYSAFAFDDGTTPRNWGQLRKAVLDGKKVHKTTPSQNSGNDQNNGSNQNEGKDKNKDKGGGKHKNNGSGNGNKKGK